MSRTSEIAQIHIAKKELALDDETYRAMLWTCARVNTSKDLDYAGRAKVLAHLKARGFKPSHQKPATHKAKQDLVSKIAALLTDMALSWNYAHSMAKRMYKRDQLQWCSPEELRGIIAALVKKQQKAQDEQRQNS